MSVYNGFWVRQQQDGRWRATRRGAGDDFGIVSDSYMMLLVMIDARRGVR